MLTELGSSPTRLSAPGNFAGHRFHVLDGMRGIAAIAVIEYHYGLLRGWLDMPNAFIAVDMFFMLSGFVICHAYGGKVTAGMPPGQYMARRIARLFPTLALGIAIGLPAFYWLTTQGENDYSIPNILESAASNLLFLPAFTGRQVFYPGLRVDELFPIDPPLWSIFFEMVASGAFLAFVKWPERQLAKFTVAAFVLIVVGALLSGLRQRHLMLDPDAGWSLENLLRGFPRVFYGFAFGMLIYQSRLRLAGTRPLRAMQSLRPTRPLWLYLGLVAVLLFPFKLAGLYYLLAIGVFAPLLIMQGGKADGQSPLLVAGAEWLGWISYPLYCLHMPVLDATDFLFERFGHSLHQDLSSELAASVVTLVLAVVSAALFDRFVHRQLLALLLRTSHVVASF